MLILLLATPAKTSFSYQMCTAPVTSRREKPYITINSFVVFQDVEIAFSPKSQGISLCSMLKKEEFLVSV